MLLDATLLLADGVTTTTSAASTDYIDCQAAGNDYKGCIFVAKTDTTAFAVKNGAPSVDFQLQTSDNTSFSGARSSVFTLCAATGLLAADLGASTLAAAVVIPPGALRYLRGYYSISNYSAGTHDFSACSYSMFIVIDADRLISGRF